MKNTRIFYLALAIAVINSSCASDSNHPVQASGSAVRLITLDPAHFHAALVQKSMYPGIDSTVYVYAPDGLGLREHLNYIRQYNGQAQSPTGWTEKVYTGNDYFQRMLDEKKGNAVVLAGNNSRKASYIKKSIDVGINVLADKPMAINTAGFDTLKEAFSTAKNKGLLLYDIMTERSEITTVLQKMLMHMPSVFGELKQGTPGSPAVILESIHRYRKNVSGKPLLRPDWFFDPLQEGDAIVDVGTHLVDLVQWVCFPEVPLDYSKDIRILSSKTWPTPLTLSQFSQITGEDHFPDFLKNYVSNDSILLTHGNGTIDYTIKNVHARVTVKWTYEAPAGGGDTYSSRFAGTKAILEIRTGKEESWKSTLYVWPSGAAKDTAAFFRNLENGIQEINIQFPGVSLEKYANGWKIVIPDKYAQGHESHFAEVMKRYLQYLKDGKLPDWEESGMIAKYFTTTKALEMAQQPSKAR